MTEKYYYRKNDEEYCYSIAEHREYMTDHNLLELTLWLAKVEHHSAFFFCVEFGEIGVRAKYICGSFNCQNYIANNGKSGKCKHYRLPREKTDEKIVLKTEKREIK